MAKQKNDNYSNVSTLKKVVVIFGLFTSLFGGMFAAIVAVDNYKNYISPYSFTFLCGGIGLVAGLYVAKLIKPYVILNKIMLSNYYLLTIQFSVGFIGSFMLLGFYFNSAISSQVKCDEFSVVDTEYTKGGYRRTERNTLYVNIDGKIETFLCKRAYWQSINVGQKVNVCIYGSPIGFDNLVLTYDH
jgi:hypothetical protein